MVVTLTQRGYIKRTELTAYKAQNRGGKGITGAKSDGEDPIQNVFVASTHSYLLFFTNLGKVYWQKVYDLPLQNRTAKGRALVNLLSLSEGEYVANCIDVREFDDERFLMMATKKGVIKKTALSAYSRPLKGGLIAIKLDEDDQLIEVVKVTPTDDIVLSTSNGMSIRFNHTDARSQGRNTRGVKGISLGVDDFVIGMVIVNEQMALLTACEHGHGKRTPFGPGDTSNTVEADAASNTVEADATVEGDENTNAPETDAGTPQVYKGNMRYRRQRRGGKGLRDIRTSDRNGQVVAILAVADDDDVLMISTGGKIQRIRAADISQVGRNTQGVRVMRLSKGDNLAALARIPAEIGGDDDEEVEGTDTEQTGETSEPVANSDATAPETPAAEEAPATEETPIAEEESDSSEETTKE